MLHLLLSLLPLVLGVAVVARLGWSIGDKLIYFWNYIIWEFLPSKVAKFLSIN